LRADALGEQAAQALAELDEKQSAWNRKLDAFSARYQQINASDLPPDSKQQQLDALLESQFDAQERAHAMVYVEFR
jgi:lipase chaperone LimK